jgi:2-hydroxychromene-2-carboxylate isomerase
MTRMRHESPPMNRAACTPDSLSPRGRDQDLADATVLAGLLDQAGFDGAMLLREAAEAEYIERLDRQTSEAAERGAFGSPTFFVRDQMFFGNDRLDFVIEAASAPT